MVERVRTWLANGVCVKIVTARVAMGEPGVVRVIEDWCEEHIGQRLPITCTKDFGMLALWDDRAVQVVRNTGARVEDEAELACALVETRVLLDQALRAQEQTGSTERRTATGEPNRQ